MLQSLRVRIALAFGLGTLLLVAALSAALSVAASATSLRDQGSRLQALARSNALLLANGLSERLNEVEWLASAPRTGGWDAVLRRLQAGRPQYSWIGVAGSDGRVRAATGDLLLGASVAQRPWFQAGIQGPFVGDVHAAKLLATLLPPNADGEPPRFIDFAAPVRGADGRVDSVLGVHAAWDWARSVIDTLQKHVSRESGVLVFIFDRSGELILCPRGVDARGRAVALAALPASGAATVAWDDGVAYLTAGWKLPANRPEADLGWTIVTRQPVLAALAPARAARDTALVLGIVAAVVSSLFAWRLAGRFSRPLERIAAAANAVQAGSLTTEIPRPGGAREIDQLAAALHGMQQSLLQRERELERRVAERTAQLLEATTALERVNGELRSQATLDALTGLPNRRAGDERLLMEFARHRRSGRPLALVLADIDHFKVVNDRHGHAAGDAVLREVARCLAAGCRATDFVARWGGEEFMLLLPETGSDGAAAACEKLRLAVAAHPGRVRVTLSLGIAVPAQEFDDLEAALRAADDALYAAKAGGRNRFRLAGSQAVLAA